MKFTVRGEEEKALLVAKYVLSHGGAGFRSISMETKSVEKLQPLVEGCLEKCQSLERLEPRCQDDENSLYTTHTQLAGQIFSKLGECEFPAGLHLSFGNMSLFKSVFADALLFIRGPSSKASSQVEFLACSIDRRTAFLELSRNPKTAEAEFAQISYSAARPTGPAERHRSHSRAGRWPVKERRASVLTLPASSVAGAAEPLQVHESRRFL